MFYNFSELGINTNGRTSGRLKTTCPQCKESRHNKADKSLSVHLDEGIFKCHHCGWSGRASDSTSKQGRQPGEVLVGWQEERRKQVGKSHAAFAPATPSSIVIPATDQESLTVAQLAYLTDTRKLSAESIAALGIASAMHFMPQTGRQERCICFNFYENGQLVNTKFRTSPEKHFALVQGAELIPYHIDAIRGSATCIITEGEYDAAAFVTAGRTDVISVPNGANRNLDWMDRFAESHFEDKRVVYLAVDTDTKGNELRRELLRRIGPERCRIVTYGADCKDANELLIKEGPDALLRALDEAPEQPLEGVFCAADVALNLRALFENGLGRGAETGLDDFDALCTFEPGRLCVVTGHPGDGKSEFVDELVLRLCLRHGWKTAFFSPENQPLEYHLSKLFEKLTGCKFKQGYLSEALYASALEFLNDNITSILPQQHFQADAILSRARELVSRRGTRVVVIDPFNRLEHQIPAGQTETQYISSFLDTLSNFAQRNQCLVILVAHPRKMQRDPATGRFPVPALQDINGSAAFVNKADFGLVVERDMEAGVTRIHVRKVKFRNLGKVGEASFVYNTSNGRYSPCRENREAEPANRVTATQFDNRPWIGRQEAEARQGELGM